ncbi:MAG: HAMP domain-containing protein [Cyanobacteria bacterium REEB67]|nr:HAMP domain-containing protein [Cyanobacteria bacterium REEB67]
MSFAVIFSCLIIVLLASYSGFREIAANQEAIYANDMPASILLVTLSSNIKRLRAAEQILIMGQDPTVKDKQIEEIIEMQQENQKIFPRLKELFARDKGALDSLIHLEKEIAPTYDVVNQELRAAAETEPTDEEKIARIRGERQRVSSLIKLSDQVTNMPLEFAEHHMQATKERISTQFVLFSIAAIVIVILSLAQMLIINIDLLQPLKHLTGAVKAVEQGDLDTKLDFGDRKDELGILQGAFVSMQEALKIRTDELTLAVDSLNESNRELQHFAYVAAHDLQEPLRTVVSYLGLLEKRLGPNLDDKGRKYVTNAMSGAERMRSLIKGLLDIARITTKAKPHEQIDCRALVKQIVEDLHVFLAEQQGTIKIGELPVVTADGTQLSQVFQNLIQNAIKFKGIDDPVVTIDCKVDGDKWLFSVRDNGLGMNMEYSERIFAIFQRLHTTAEYAGTGIGLAVCKKIVERHGGKIWVQSEEGKGSTFYFTIANGDEASKKDSSRYRRISGPLQGVTTEGMAVVADARRESGKQGVVDV